MSRKKQSSDQSPPSLAVVDVASPTRANGDTWEMHAGDCIEGLKQLADDSVDVSISDPPYDDHTHAKQRRGGRIAEFASATRQSRATFNRKRSIGFAAITPDQMDAVSLQLARVVRRWSIVFCTVEMISDWKRSFEQAGLEYVRTCVWHKLGSTPQFTGDRPAVAVEAIVCAHRPGRKRWNGGGKHGYYAHPIVLDRNNLAIRCHDTQKPVSLMRELVTDFSDERELILDAYAGSGSTGVAARMESRRFVGFERLDGTVMVLDKDKTPTYPNHFATACRRLRGESGPINSAQLDMLAGVA